MSTPRTMLLGSAAAAVLFAACNHEPARSAARTSPAPPTATASPAAPLPAGHPPVAASQQPPGVFELPTPTQDAGTGAAGLRWDVPKGWTVQTPSSSMRKAQYAVPGPGGDAELVVFYFGPGQGGDPLDNANRWAGQFVRADGKPVTAPQTKTFEVGGLKLLTVEVAGTYVGGMGSQAGEKPGYMLLGAVAEGPDANWFFKLTGPEKTVSAQRAAFDALVQSLKKGS